MIGVSALRQLITGSNARDVTAVNAPMEFEAPALSTLVDKIAADQRGLVMLMGKGGVGKTTLAAAIAVELADPGFPVHLTTSDPAAHLSETLNGSVDNLTVSRIDPQVEIQKYRDHVLTTKRTKLDAEGRALLEEDLRSPCTEKIAVFHAFSAIIRESTKKFVVMDTAPTGHTLLLLDATGAYHREIARQFSQKSMHVTTPMMCLQDEKQTKVILVTVAETTPVLEAANLQADLHRAGIEPWAWVINNCIAAAHPTSPLLRRRALNELKEIKMVSTRHARLYAVVPLLREEPIGSVRLSSLSGTAEPIST
jgi:arsenite/tail-anchored protein-transporting ATPase